MLGFLATAVGHGDCRPALLERLQVVVAMVAAAAMAALAQEAREAVSGAV